MIKRLVALVVATAVSLTVIAMPSHALGFAPAAKGVDGQILAASKSSKLSTGEKVTVTGLGFDTKHGIYVAFCQLPARGLRPENCYGGINLDGKGAGSVWITNKVPFATMKLAKRYGKNGSFSVQIQVSQLFGSTNCKVVKCAIVTRADHFEPDFRRADVFIPVTFK